MKKVATGIETNKWNEIIAGLKRQGWISKNEYDLFDKGIDFDFMELTDGQDKILFAWDNWFEGELKTTEGLIEKIETMFDIKFQFGKPEHLTPSLIEKTINLIRK